ncbi:hypothetical protein ETAA8_03890 [Anatilimnocola aggregata]|uniref:Tetratricopeptide repeat protein n=1 Tax=Anatilimnocola aggregata TaxID=2528021 RepID=A0A517Y503_9BACT|nr:hypothetical protein [Anatilimnocola aggregata]QDU25324.1 hypothetical protein ETAA8_03890 [Anatilimnocola aggregata]
MTRRSSLEFGSLRLGSRAKLAAWLFAGALVGLAGFTESAQAIEPARAFLEGLRERGYYDVAIDYLDVAAKNPAVPAEFKTTLQYERGVTLVDGAKAQRDPALREKQLDEGQQALQKFIGSNSSHILVIAARSHLGNVVVERARARMKKSEKALPAQKSAFLTEARTFYTEALKVFEDLTTEIGEKLKAYPAALDEKKEAKKFEEREQFRKDYLQSQLLQAATREEMAETYEAGAKDRTTALETAAKEYGEIYSKYRTRLAGLYARMYQARCLQKLGKHKDALGYFNELLANPDNPEPFRVMRVKVTELAMASWIDQKLYLEIIDKNKEKRPVQLVDSARPAEDRSEEFMSIRVDIARAMKLYADELKAKDAKDPNARKLLVDGGKLVRYVMKFPGPFQERARNMIGDFGGDGGEVTDKPEPKNFADARKVGKESIDEMQAANTLVKSLPDRLKTLKDPAERTETQKQLEDATKQAAQATDDAVRYLKLAMGYVEPATPVEEVNLVRYLLCYLAYTKAEYLEAAVVGDFISRRYPDAQGARQCAKITMASYIKLYGEKDPQNPDEKKDFEAQQIVSICKYITQKWPDSTEAAEALNTLIPFMIKEKRLAEAQTYLDQIPADHASRGAAELKMGQALWAAYLEGSKQLRDWENGTEIKPEGVDLAAKKTELDSLKSKAKTTLIDGVARMQASGEVNPIVVTAVLSLAQIYVDTNEPAKAAALLEDPKVGTLVLVRKNDPTTQREGFPEETYKTALRSYISSLGTAGGNADETVTKAKGVMESLNQLVSADEKGQSKLIGIYVSLARDLQKQMELAEPASKVALGKGFEAFLGQMAKESKDLKVLNWVAETYRGMGESFGPASKGINPEAARYFAEANATYQRILDTGKKDPTYLQPAMATSLRLSVARTNRSMGKFKEAMDLFDEILKAQNMLLPVQIEAARTYQDWGALKGEKMEDNYQRAIFGARPMKDPKTKQDKNNVWGWAQVARIVASNAQYKDIFHEARFNLALCRYNYAMAQKTDVKKKEQLAYAKKDVAIMYGFYPDLGGDKWRAQYDSLLKNVQQALGERPLGLAALRQPEPPAANSTTPTKAGTTTAPTTTTKAAGSATSAK